VHRLQPDASPQGIGRCKERQNPASFSHARGCPLLWIRWKGSAIPKTICSVQAAPWAGNLHRNAGGNSEDPSAQARLGRAKGDACAGWHTIRLVKGVVRMATQHAHSLTGTWARRERGGEGRSTAGSMAPLSMTFGHSSGLSDVAIVRAPTDGTAHLITTGADTLIMARPLDASSKTPVDTSAEQEVGAALCIEPSCSRTGQSLEQRSLRPFHSARTQRRVWRLVCELRMLCTLRPPYTHQTGHRCPRLTLTRRV
jgi:hypothetical protein